MFDYLKVFLLQRFITRSMTFSALPVFLAFLLNRCSIRFFTACRCVLGFSPFSASCLFGLSLVALLVKHPELYPSWLRRVNFKIMFFYELFASIIFIEIGFCLWNSVETFLFYRIPSFIEEHCLASVEFYIYIVESQIGVSLISNALALSVLLFTLHITRVCNFNLLLTKNGIHKFFADAGLTTRLCKHHRDLRQYQQKGNNCEDLKTGNSVPISSNTATKLSTPKSFRGSKTLRSGKKIF